MAVRIRYLVHGTSTDNERKIASGWKDAGLSETGLSQATGLGASLEDKHFDLVFCSDLVRARQTAELAFKGRVEIIQDRRLRECNYGEYNGRPSSIVEPLQEAHTRQRFPGGESYEDVKARVAGFLDFLIRDHDGKTVALVSHKAPQLALEVLLRGKSWEQAFAEDWRKTGSWQPGWEYFVTETNWPGRRNKGQ